MSAGNETCKHPPWAGRNVRVAGRETTLYHCDECGLVKGAPASPWREATELESAAVIQAQYGIPAVQP